jgi:hypothetical protein
MPVFAPRLRSPWIDAMPVFAPLSSLPPLDRRNACLRSPGWETLGLLGSQTFFLDCAMLSIHTREFMRGVSVAQRSEEGGPPDRPDDR